MGKEVATHAGVIADPENISTVNVILPVPPNTRTEEIKTFVFVDASTCGLFTDKNTFPLIKTRDPQEFSELLNRTLSLRSTYYPPVGEISFLAVSVKVFKMAVQEMKQNYENSIRAKVAFSNRTTPVDPNITEVEAARRQLECGSDLPLRRLSQINKKFNTEEWLSFAEYWEEFRIFLEKIEKPAALIAHNGMHFDFRVLYGELLRHNLLNEDDTKMPKGFYMVDSMYASMNIDDLFIDHINAKLKNKEYGEENPWEKIQRETETIALKKRFKSDDVELNRYGEWQIRVKNQKGRTTVEGLYRQLIGDDTLDFHTSLDDCKATLQICLAYGDKFLEYAEEVAAPLPFCSQTTKNKSSPGEKRRRSPEAEVLPGPSPTKKASW